MDANQQKHYDSIVSAELEQRQNFEELYKEVFNISEMPVNDSVKGKLAKYKRKAHNEAYHYFLKKTSIQRHRGGVQMIWNDIGIIQWLCRARFANTPEYDFIENANCTWGIKWDRSKIKEN